MVVAGESIGRFHIEIARIADQTIGRFIETLTSPRWS
jgi:hypothetical protein